MEPLKDYLDVSSEIYKLLGWPWYMEINNTWLTRIKAYQPVFEELAVQTGIENLSEGAGLLKRVEASLEEEGYARMFAVLFLGVNIHAEVGSITPHESVYLSPSGLVKQEPWDRVLEFYVKEGIGLNGFTEPEDHISAELNFLSILGKQAKTFLEEGNYEAARQKLDSRFNFLQKHILKWTDKLQDHLLTLTEDPYYRAVGHLTRGFAEADALFLEAALSEFTVS